MCAERSGFYPSCGAAGEGVAEAGTTDKTSWTKPLPHGRRGILALAGAFRNRRERRREGVGRGVARVRAVPAGDGARAWQAASRRGGREDDDGAYRSWRPVRRASGGGDGGGPTAGHDVSHGDGAGSRR